MPDASADKIMTKYEDALAARYRTKARHDAAKLAATAALAEETAAMLADSDAIDAVLAARAELKQLVGGEQLPLPLDPPPWQDLDSSSGIPDLKGALEHDALQPKR